MYVLNVIFIINEKWEEKNNVLTRSSFLLKGTTQEIN